MYIDSESFFQKQQFQQFSDVVEDHSYTISQEWVVDLNDEAESLSFHITNHTYAAHKLCVILEKKLSVSRSDFDDVVSLVKGQCRDAEMLIAELDKRFPDSDLVNAFSIVFLQLWLLANCDDLFLLYMKTQQHHFSVTRSMNAGSKEEPVIVQCEPLLDTRTLGEQASLFMFTMKSNCNYAMAKHGTLTR